MIERLDILEYLVCEKMMKIELKKYDDKKNCVRLLDNVIKNWDLGKFSDDKKIKLRLCDLISGDMGIKKFKNGYLDYRNIDSFGMLVNIDGVLDRLSKGEGYFK